MRTFAIALLTSLPLVATAAPFSAAVGDVETVEIEGTVSVPLYADSGDITRPTVLTTIPGGEDGEDQDFFFGLSTSSKVIVVSDAFVAAAGLKVKTKNQKVFNIKGEKNDYLLGGEIKTVTIPQLKIGELILRDVNALVSSSKHGLGGVHHDLQLGLGAIPGLAWAILPSSGEVKFSAAGTDGAALVSSVGTGTDTSTTDWDNPKFGEDKVLASAATLLSRTTVGGSEVVAALEVASAGSSISATVELDSSAHKSQADRQSYWVETSLTEGWVRSTSSFDRGAHPNHQAVIGANLLSAFDIAHDPESQTVAMSAADEVSWTSQRDHHLAEALGALEAPVPTEGEDTDKSEEEAAGPNVGALVTLAHAYEASTQLADAIDTWNQIVEAEPDSCSHYLSLGKALLASGDVEAALEPLSDASRLYHTWWDVDLATRTTISDYRAAEKEEGLKRSWKLMFLDVPAADAPESQAGSCHVADGLLAAAHLAQGNTGTVSSIYDSHLDLDPALAQAQGTASLSSGDTQSAHAALRQALKREASPQVDSRIGLAQAYLQDGDWSTAEQHYLKALSIDSTDSVLVSLWVDAKFESDGAKSTLEAATAWAEARPGSIAAQYGQIRAAWLAEDTAAMAAGATEAEVRMEHIARLALFPSQSLASLARVRALSGNSAGAIEAAQSAVDMDPGLGEAWLALAEAQAASGTPDSDALAQASRVQPLTPGLGGQAATFEAPLPEDAPEDAPEEAPAE